MIDSDEDVSSTNSLYPMNSSIADGQDCPDGDESPSPTLSTCHRNGVPGPQPCNQKQARKGLNYVPVMEMALRLSAGPRSDLLAAMENADSATGPDPGGDPMRIPSNT